MSLQCNNCGGAVVVQDGSYGQNSMFERYACPDCDSTGTMTITEFGNKHFTGCLE